MWTQEWSDIPSRSEWTWAMYHQARTCSSLVDRLEEALELAVAAGRRPDLGLGDRLVRRLALRALRVGSRDALFAHVPTLAAEVRPQP